MKAIEILEEMLISDEYEYMNVLACDFTRAYVEKAVDELKGFKYRSCENCKQIDCPMYLEAVNYNAASSKTEFCCNKWENK